MKSLIVPKTSIPPAEETVVVQMTRSEGLDLMTVCDFYHTVAGTKTLASVSLMKHLSAFLERFAEKGLK